MERWKAKRVFISGGAGVIGRELVGRLDEAGASVWVGDLKPRPRGWPGRIRYRQGDLNHLSPWELQDFDPHYFFHLAATFERAVETPEFWPENDQHNVRLSHHLLDLCRDLPALGKVIFASSYLIYDPAQYCFAQPAEKAVRLAEEASIRPRNLCGAAKLMHEVELAFVQQQRPSTLQVVCARIFRVYGKGSRDVIGRWIRAALAGEAITVYGQQGRFDYIYAGEVAEGLMRLGQSAAEGIVNLGTDQARQVAEVVAILRGHFPGLTIQQQPAALAFEASQAKMERFNELVGWAPQGRLEDYIPELIAFEKAGGWGAAAAPVGPNLLVTSISKKVPLLQALRRACGKLGNGGRLIGADADPGCIGRHFVDQFWAMPRLSSLSFEQLAAFCQAHQVGVLIPTRDGELAFFAQHRQALNQRGVAVMVSEPDAVQVCLDKLTFYKRLRARGYPVIPTSTVLEEVDGASLVVKERYGAGAKSLGLNLTPGAARDHASALDQPIFQPYIEGDEYSVDLYLDATGKAKGVIARSRDVVVDGESQVTTTAHYPALETLCVDVAQDLGLYGHAVFQVLVDASGAFQLVECNPRLGGASPLSLAAGLDSLYWFLLEAGGESLADYPFCRTRQELRLVRHVTDEISYPEAGLIQK